ncbi:hypothetical protein BLGI_1962 [Brevibacillus laterosporus GI-9]|nr:hypothetical protein BLGI_1962 [Brevibacillus laterosporus GI-9]
MLLIGICLHWFYMFGIGYYIYDDKIVIFVTCNTYPIVHVIPI